MSTSRRDPPGEDWAETSPEEMSDPTSKYFQESLRPVVREIVREMAEGPGGRTPEQLSRWTRLVSAVCDELHRRRAIVSAAHDVAVSQLKEQIEISVSRVFDERFEREKGVVTVLTQLGRVYLRISEAAKIADCSERTIKRAIDAGELVTYYAGADPRIRLDDFERYMARRNPGEPGGGE